jgi:hypothetical protein
MEISRKSSSVRLSLPGRARTQFNRFQAVNPPTFMSLISTMEKGTWNTHNCCGSSLVRNSSLKLIWCNCIVECKISNNKYCTIKMEQLVTARRP